MFTPRARAHLGALPATPPLVPGGLLVAGGHGGAPGPLSPLLLIIPLDFSLDLDLIRCVRGGLLFSSSTHLQPPFLLPLPLPRPASPPPAAPATPWPHPPPPAPSRRPPPSSPISPSPRPVVRAGASPGPPSGPPTLPSRPPPPVPSTPGPPAPPVTPLPLPPASLAAADAADGPLACGPGTVPVVRVDIL